MSDVIPSPAGQLIRAKADQTALGASICAPKGSSPAWGRPAQGYTDGPRSVSAHISLASTTLSRSLQASYPDIGTRVLPANPSAPRSLRPLEAERFIYSYTH